MDVVVTLIRRAAQVIFFIFAFILHPGFKWLVRLLTRSRLVRNYVRPALEKLTKRFYDRYFEFLRGLPPWWATVSIAVPLAALEPAKLYATILIAERPRVGIALWLLLQGLSIILIDKTWAAVRPQSRKIWIVSRLHAWGWLNISYGKYWIMSSAFYRALIGWKDRVQVMAQAFWLRLLGRRRAKTL